MYRIAQNVVRARGYRTFLVKADSKEEALAKHEAGESEFEDEELEVLEYGEEMQISEAGDDERNRRLRPANRRRHSEVH